MSEQYSEGIGQPMQGVEHPADGTMSSEISNNPAQEVTPEQVLGALDSIKEHIDNKFGQPVGSSMTVTHLHRVHEHFLAFRQDLEHLLGMERHVARGEDPEED